MGRNYEKNQNNSVAGAQAIEDWVGLSWRASSLSHKVYVLNSINSSLTALQ